MAKLFAVYHQPVDTAAFDDSYFSKHAPLANTLAGLRGDEVAQDEVMRAAGKHGVEDLVGILESDTMASPQGLGAAADLANFTGAGMDLMMGKTRLV